MKMKQIFNLTIYIIFHIMWDFVLKDTEVEIFTEETKLNELKQWTWSGINIYIHAASKKRFSINKSKSARLKHILT